MANICMQDNWNYMYLDIRHALQSIDQDIVILGGARQEGMNETILFYQAVNPAVESVLIPDTKHLPHLEAPEKVLDQLKIFIYIKNRKFSESARIH